MMKKSIFTYASCILATVLFVYCSKDDPKKPDTPDGNPPFISSFNPTKGNVGVSVTIDGGNFGATAAENIVKFNGTKATVTDASTTQLTVTVPAGATDGKISVEVDGQETKSTGTFTVTTESEDELSITGFDPQQGIVGTMVTIDGTGFSPNKVDNTVEFNGVICTVSSATAGQLQVIVPSGATDGKISVEVGNETVQSLGNFVVPLPTITSFTPEQGVEDTEVEITGTNFSPTAENNVIEFNGTPATITEASSTALTATVPEGATTGKITVNVGGQEVESTDDFTIGPWKNLGIPWWMVNKDPVQSGNMAILKDVDDHNQIYFGFGLYGTTYSDGVYVYDPDEGTWSGGATCPGSPRFRAASFVKNNKWYIITGTYQGNDVDDTWYFDPATAAWDGMASNWGSGLTSFVNQDVGYVYGIKTLGDDGKLKSFDGNTWTDLAGFKEYGDGNLDAVGFSIGTQGYVITGKGALYSDSMFRYSIANDSWTELGSILPFISRTKAIGFNVGNKGYVGLGRGQDSSYLNDIWEYDASSNSWTQKTSFPGGGRQGSAVVVLDEHVYIFGGVGPGTDDELRTFWRYTPSLDLE